MIEGLGSEDLTLEDAAEVGCDAVGRLEQCWRRGLRGFEFEGRNGAVGDAAGDDPVEVAQIRGHVQGESVGGDGLRDVDTDGGDLLFADASAGQRPDAGQFGDALRGDAEVFAGEDKSFFDETDEVDRAKMGTAFAGEIAAEIEDGVADELAGAVVGDVAATIDLVDLDAAACEQFVTGEDVGAGGIAAEGENGWMLEKDERVPDGTGFACRDEFGLDVQAFGVRGAAELKEMQVHGLVTGPGR